MATLHMQLDFLVPKGPLGPSNSTICPRTAPKRPPKAPEFVHIGRRQPKPKIDHILGYVAQNLISSAPNPPATMKAAIRPPFPRLLTLGRSIPYDNVAGPATSRIGCAVTQLPTAVVRSPPLQWVLDTVCFKEMTHGTLGRVNEGLSREFSHPSYPAACHPPGSSTPPPNNTPGSTLPHGIVVVDTRASGRLKTSPLRQPPLHHSPPGTNG